MQNPLWCCLLLAYARSGCLSPGLRFSGRFKIGAPKARKGTRHGLGIQDACLGPEKEQGWLRDRQGRGAVQFSGSSVQWKVQGGSPEGTLAWVRQKGCFGADDKVRFSGRFKAGALIVLKVRGGAQ